MIVLVQMTTLIITLIVLTMLILELRKQRKLRNERLKEFEYELQNIKAQMILQYKKFEKP